MEAFSPFSPPSHCVNRAEVVSSAYGTCHRTVKDLSCSLAFPFHDLEPCRPSTSVFHQALRQWSSTWSSGTRCHFVLDLTRLLHTWLLQKADNQSLICFVVTITNNFNVCDCIVFTTASSTPSFLMFSTQMQMQQSEFKPEFKANGIYLAKQYRH